MSLKHRFSTHPFFHSFRDWPRVFQKYNEKSELLWHFPCHEFLEYHDIYIIPGIPRYLHYTFLKSLLNVSSAFGVEITWRSGNILDNGSRVFTWQWSSKFWVMSNNSNSGRSSNCQAQNYNYVLTIFSRIIMTLISTKHI